MSASYKTWTVTMHQGPHAPGRAGGFLWGGFCAGRAADPSHEKQHRAGGDIYSLRRCCSESLAHSQHSAVCIQLALTCVHSQGKPHSCSLGPVSCVERGQPSLGEALGGGWMSGCPPLTASPGCWAVGDPPPTTSPLPAPPLVGGVQAGQSGTLPQQPHLFQALPQWAGRRLGSRPAPSLPALPPVGGAQAWQLPHPVPPSRSPGGRAVAAQ